MERIACVTTILSERKIGETRLSDCLSSGEGGCDTGYGERRSPKKNADFASGSVAIM